LEIYTRYKARIIISLVFIKHVVQSCKNLYHYIEPNVGVVEPQR